MKTVPENFWEGFPANTMLSSLPDFCRTSFEPQHNFPVLTYRL